MVISVNREFQSYYTYSAPIVEYMINLLEPKAGLRYLEPAAGDGIFIEPLTRYADVAIDAFDIDPMSVESLRRKFKQVHYVNISQKDTLVETGNDLFFESVGAYDRIIANPPYGAWQDYEKRKYLKKLYPGCYVKETYALFLYKCIELLNDEGVLVFIIPDTFLNLHMHTKLREYILENTRICEISLFPSKFFPNVNFGYSNLCIIKVKRCSNKARRMRNKIVIKTGHREVEDLSQCPSYIQRTEILQEDMYKNVDHALFVSGNNEITAMINKAEERIGDVADCVTGFYSGNDKAYLRALNEGVKGAKKYKKATPDLIYTGKSILLNGIRGSKMFIPIMKGGSFRYFKPTLWYMDWGEESVAHYKNDRKARFQNSQYYFRQGIGVPMVSSSRISAALIERRLFDQSIVGIFPHEKKHMYYLLAFFNSKLCNVFIRTINRSANNSANYIGKIPFVRPDDNSLEFINSRSKEIFDSYERGVPAESIEQELERALCDLYEVDVCNHQ